MKMNFKKLLLILFMLVPLIITIASLNYLPDLIPAHYGFNGEVTRYGSKYESLIIPIIGGIACGISFICTSYAEKNPKYKNNIKMLNVCNIVLAFTFNLLTLSFLISSFNGVTNFNESISSKLMYIGLGIIFIIIGNYLPKCKRNSFIGIRTPSTLSNDDIWFKTHRFGGKVFVIFGIIFTLISIFVSSNLLIFLLLGGLITVAIIVSVYPSKIKKSKTR